MKFLHVGCGPKYKSQTTKGFNNDSFQEIRFDINPIVSPDIIGTMTDMSMINNSEFDAIFSAHNIEHLYAHEVDLALLEFNRILNKNGYLVINCPDLQSISKLVAEDKLTEMAYMSSAGPICPIDVIFGFRESIAKGNYYMAHKYGFTSKVLIHHLKKAGFISIATMRREINFDLWAIASKQLFNENDIRELAKIHFPS